jgi:hypothetical protein
MKKIVLFAATAIACAAAYGQGTVNFSNRVLGSGVDAPVFYGDAGSTTRVEGDAYLAQLWAAPAGGTLAPVGPAVPFRTGTLAGYILTTATETNPDGSLRAVDGVAAGSPALVQVRAWASSLGDTWEEAAAAGLGGTGMSGELTITTGGGLNPPGPLIGLTSFNVATVIPEPSIAALGILGAGLLLIRRKK